MYLQPTKKYFQLGFASITKAAVLNEGLQSLYTENPRTGPNSPE